MSTIVDRLAQYRVHRHSPVPVTIVLGGAECIDYHEHTNKAALNDHGRQQLLARVTSPRQAKALVRLHDTISQWQTARQLGESPRALDALVHKGLLAARDDQWPRRYMITADGRELVAWTRGERP